MSNSISYYGNHRGGTSIISRQPANFSGLYSPEWVFADPKEDRAERLAGLAKERFPTIHPMPLSMTAQEALSASKGDGTLVLAIDTIADTRAVIESRGPKQQATFQIVGRGPGGNAGMRTALQGTVAPGDDATAKRVSLLLGTLENMTREASSRALTGGTDPLTAILLRPLRDMATRQTVRHLTEVGREPWDMTGGPLNMVLGPHTYPVIPTAGSTQDKYSHHRQHALDAVGGIPENRMLQRGALGKYAIAAVVVPERGTIYFMTVVQTMKGTRRVNGVTVFEAPLPVPVRANVVEERASLAPEIDAAVFTD